ncbi:hypothetical protein CsatB_001212 [Cannabis sativa]
MGDTKVALTNTIYEKVRSSFFPHTVRLKALKTEKGRSSYLCNYSLCWPLLRSSLCPILSYQTRLTSDQPAKGCEVGPGTKNESISMYKRIGDCSTVRAQYSGGWFRFDKGSMPSRRSSTVGSRRVRFCSRARTRIRRCTFLAATYVDLDLTDSSN